MRTSLLLACLLLSGCQGGRHNEASTWGSGPQPVALATPQQSQSLDPKHSARFEHPADNTWETPATAPLSTFSIDVDTASYSLIRSFLHKGELPPADAVRLEEIVNYFPYEYAKPAKNEPFSLNLELADCPWDRNTDLLRVGIQGKARPQDQLPPRNLVFLIDVSGSMQGPDRLGLVQYAMTRLVGHLTARDTVAIATYADGHGVLLEPTSGDQKDKILEALQGLEAAGSTNGEGGIREAYELATRHFNKNGVNRILMATDGDFNVGIRDRAELIKLVEEKRKSGVFLTTLGVGQSNLNDDGLEQLADKGNGNYAFLDTQDEAEKVLVTEAAGTLVTIAKDVKIQVEFNPKAVARYRLLGYENRVLAAEDFNDDKKDAGEVGAGHCVTALYQLERVEPGKRPTVDPLRYQKGTANTDEVALVKLRYQPPQGTTSKLLQGTLTHDQRVALAKSTDDFRFAAGAAQFGMLLRGARDAGRWEDVEALAQNSRGQDQHGYRSEFVKMVRAARSLPARQASR